MTSQTQGAATATAMRSFLTSGQWCQFVGMSGLVVSHRLLF